MEVTFHATTSFYGVHVILKTITRTRTLKGGGFGLTMCCWLHFRSTWSHVSALRELQIGHVFDGNLCMPKNNCFLALPMYWPV